jgi:hypothetical protein
MRHPIALMALLGANAASACELCAIYNASDASGQFNSGFLFTVSEQYIRYGTSQFFGEEVAIDDSLYSYVNSSITHFAPGYNFTPRFGIGLNIPLTYLRFKRTDLLYAAGVPPTLITDQGKKIGLGDVALIGRWTLFERTRMRYGIVINLLGGVKFPTGDASAIRDEVDQSRLFESFLPPGTPHDPLGHSLSSVHQHDLALGSGSYDGVFGLTLNARWHRWFLNSQFQYNLRTSGEEGFRFGDELMVSGGPGFFVFLGETWTLSLGPNAVYDTMARDELLGRPSERTGSTAWYLGPRLNFTWGIHLSANAGFDMPLRIANNGFQSVPDYRINGGISWRF